MRCRLYITFFIFSVICPFLIACTRENTDDCDARLRLHFHFTLHNHGGNLFGHEVQQVRVYLFDESGVLQQIARDNGPHLTNDYVMDISAVPGKYTLVSWGGSNEDFRNSYFEGHMNDPMTHNYEDGVTIGRTTLNDFRVILKHNIANDLPEDVVPAIDELDDLFYGAVGTRTPLTDQYRFEQVEIKTGTITDRQIELIKNTNLIKLTVTGLEYLHQNVAATLPFSTREVGEQPLQVWVTARNGRYKFDNSIGEYARSIRYTPHYQSVNENAMVVDIKVLRLDMTQRTAQPMFLTVLDPVTGVALTAQPIDVIQTLLQAKDLVTGAYIYQSQEDFDRVFEHPIDIEITADLQLRIFVKGWEIVKLKPEV